MAETQAGEAKTARVEAMPRWVVADPDCEHIRRAVSHALAPGFIRVYTGWADVRYDVAMCMCV